MFRINAIFLLAITIVLSSKCNADWLKTPIEARQLTEKIMAKIASEEFDSGLDIMKPYLIIPEAEFESMRGQAKLQNPMIAQRFGKTIGAEFIREDRIGENIIRIIHIQRLEKHPIRWLFYFYRGQNGWTINSFKFDDNIQSLF